jgi:hypothetical protein
MIMTILYISLCVVGAMVVGSLILGAVLYITHRNSPDPYTPEENAEQARYIKEYWEKKAK